MASHCRKCKKRYVLEILAAFPPYFCAKFSRIWCRRLQKAQRGNHVGRPNDPDKRGPKHKKNARRTAARFCTVVSSSAWSTCCANCTSGKACTGIISAKHCQTHKQTKRKGGEQLTDKRRAGQLMNFPKSDRFLNRASTYPARNIL